MAKETPVDVQIVERAMKDVGFRAALKKDPRAAIEKEFKVKLAKKVKVVVHEEGDNIWHIVIPKAQADVELSDVELKEVAGGSCCTCGRSTHQTFTCK
jgi:hypothetical protein